ncbi:MAG: hypothetical protein ACH254_20205 [Candidatus Thiodiazotropha endolucinida]
MSKKSSSKKQPTSSGKVKFRESYERKKENSATLAPVQPSPPAPDMPPKKPKK